jgi:hypothetical protein
MFEGFDGPPTYSARPPKEGLMDPIALMLRFMPERVRVRVEASIRDFEWTWTKAVIAAFFLWFLALTFLAVIPSWWLLFAQNKLGWSQQKFWLFKARDLIAVILFSIPFGGFIMVPYYLQKWRRRLRSESESRPTGGYR